MTLAELIERELAVIDERARQEEKLLFDAARGGPFWGVGKDPVRPGDVRGLAEFLPIPRK